MNSRRPHYLMRARHALFLWTRNVFCAESATRGLADTCGRAQIKLWLKESATADFVESADPPPIKTSDKNAQKAPDLSGSNAVANLSGSNAVASVSTEQQRCSMPPQYQSNCTGQLKKCTAACGQFYCLYHITPNNGGLFTLGGHYCGGV